MSLLSVSTLLVVAARAAMTTKKTTMAVDQTHH